ncbi:alpha/beta hydrolase [Amycolatopsis acidicola]|uniref:Alpha/beta hydrolase n=1 Tax=Amycolatopsis acidicola TaxID=2596893 RepID=A0A5N0VIZ2_9PSEU|nr:alpha/beta hydrolase [Amycolatopsis acidicola]KAA9165598.1 alpha/beta hydrolase [Amycolatopsis acidicola]
MWGKKIGTVAAIAAVLCGFTVPAQAADQHHTGTLPDGATWVADVPDGWNGTIILYSHGFGPLTAQDAPDDATRDALLDRGYALVGSSYSGPSWWALDSAVRDQFDSLRALENLIGQPRRTLAWGTSMGGLVSALESEDGGHRIDGTLTTCGLVAGALNLDDYQLNGEYALSHLLAPDVPVKLVNYDSTADATAAAATLAGVVGGAQASPQGQARTALGAALFNAPTWFTGATPPADYHEQEAQQAQQLTSFVLGFMMTGRYQVELAAGGNSSGTAGVDYRAVFARSSHAAQVRALYREAGLDLDADLAKLTRDANIHADPVATVRLARTSMATGRLRVPELDIHTVADQLVPVEQENWYGHQVAAAGSASRLWQAYVQASGHCAFTTAETLAALNALEHRVQTGQWDGETEPAALNAATGGTGRYVDFRVPPLVGA